MRLPDPIAPRRRPRTACRPRLEHCEPRTLLAASLISVNAAGTAPGNNHSGFFGEGSPAYDLSADGRYVAFTSFASDLSTTPDSNHQYDVYRRDRLLGTTSLVSVNQDGTAAGNGSCECAPAISADGRYVLFASSSSDLTETPDTNERYDLFVRDMQLGVTKLITLGLDGMAAGYRHSDYIPLVMSEDGQYVAFASNATNHTSLPDTNNASDIFLCHVPTGQIRLISAHFGQDAAANGESRQPSLSANGLFVAFESEATDLVDLPDTNNRVDVFLAVPTSGPFHDVSLVSINSEGTAAGNDYSWIPRISADGNSVAFVSHATDLTTVSDTNTNDDVFVRRGTVTELISINAAGTATANHASGMPIISDDGSLILFMSRASDLTSTPDSNTFFDAFARDLDLGTTTLLSVDKTGAAARGASELGSISGDNRLLTFASYADDLTLIPDANNATDVFVRDRVAGTILLASTNQEGTSSANRGSYGGLLSHDGSTLLFLSDATDLTTIPDTAENSDLFALELEAPPVEPASLSINTIINPSPAIAGQNLTITTTVTNEGLGAANNLSLIVQLSGDFQFISATSSEFTVVIGAENIEGLLDQLAPGASATLTLIVRPEAAGSLTLEGSATSPDDPTANPFTLTIPVQPSGDIAGPIVLSLARFGVHMQPTAIVLGFNESLNPMRAELFENYRIVGPGPDHRFNTRDDCVARLREVLYDDLARTVTITPRKRLPLCRTYQITVRGTGESPVIDSAGNPLDGNRDGTNGDDHVARFNRSALVIPQDAVREIPRALAAPELITLPTTTPRPRVPRLRLRDVQGMPTP